MSEYPPDWDVIELGRVGTWLSGGTPSTNNPVYWDGDIPWISAASLKSFDISESERNVTELGARSGTRRVPAGTVIFVVRGMSLKSEFRVGVSSCEVTFGQDCKAILPGGVNARFLAYSLKAKEGEILALVDEAGHGTGRLPTGQLEKVVIGLPATDSEQGDVLRIFDTIDESIRSMRKVVVKREQIKRGLVEDIVRRGLSGSGDGWRLCRLGDIAESITSGSRGWGSRYADSGAIFLRIGNLTRKSIDLRLDKVVRVVPPDSSEVQRTAVIPGDVLISITADLGIIGVVPDGLGEAYINQHVAMVRMGNGGMVGRWIGYYLASDLVQDGFRMLNDAGAKAGLNLTSISRLKVVIPENECEIADSVAVLDAEAHAIRAIEFEIQKLAQLKIGLMSDLLSGRVRVKMDSGAVV